MLSPDSRELCSLCASCVHNPSTHHGGKRVFRIGAGHGGAHVWIRFLLTLRKRAVDYYPVCGSCGHAVAQVPMPAPQPLAVPEASVAGLAGVTSRMDQPLPESSGAAPTRGATPAHRSPLSLDNSAHNAASTRPTTAPTAGGARFFGDAAPIAGIPLSRILNSACYLIAGIACLVMSTQPNYPAVWLVLIGMAGIGYGGKILVTRSSYWVSTAVYVIAVIAVVAAFTAVFH
jgi:hypothetical protein